MSYRTPRTLSTFCRTVLPLFRKATDGQRILNDVAGIVETDRWNSFDRFHDTARTLIRGYSAAGAQVEATPVPTGGRIGSGRWIVHEAADVRSATCDLLRPVQQRILDYKENPWHAVQWSASTPPNGMVTKLVVLDSPEKLNRIPAGGLTGKTVLTRMALRGQLKALSDRGAAGVITDRPVPDNPGATHWDKFGWGGIPIENAAVRLVGLALSETGGNKLRRLAQKHGSLTLRTRVDIRQYVGAHDLVSGILPGRDDPQDELWVLAHSYEPGAHDNASGVALCLEIARLIEGLIANGRLPRPRRTIRLLNAYECYGFFHYAEYVERDRPPLAGVCIDTIGAKPSICGGQLSWRATIPMSAGFVDRVGATVLRATLRLANPGYRLVQGPFVSTSDTLLGDPHYGFPCPWLTTHYRKEGKVWAAYHSSADTLAKLSPRGLAAAAVAMAGYLTYLADAGNREVVDLASSETGWTLQQLERAASPDQATSLRDCHHTSLERLKRWVKGDPRPETLTYLAQCERKVREVGPRKRAARKRRLSGASRIPHRTAFLSPTLENTPAPIVEKIQKTKLPAWALFWADGNRTLTEIARALSVEHGKEIRLEQVVAFFEAHAELGYCDFTHSKSET